MAARSRSPSFARSEKLVLDRTDAGFGVSGWGRWDESVGVAGETKNAGGEDDKGGNAVDKG